MDTDDRSLLDAVLDSWDRNNTITVNLLRAVPEDAMDVRPMEGSPSIAQLFTHLHYVRLIFVAEDAPEFAATVTHGGWQAERDRTRLAQMLNDSATVVRHAVAGRLASAQPMDRHFDHPILMLQHLLWHDAYHHGQIKLTLKMAGRAFDDEAIGPLTWGVLMKKTGAYRV